MKRIIDFDSTLDTVYGPIVDWCNSLRNSIVSQVKLLSSSTSSNPAPLSVVVLLQDGSMYRLQRTVKWVKNQILPNVQDTIEKVSSPDMDIVSQPLVVIKFKQNCCPNLLSFLRICHSIRQHGTIFKAPRVVMDVSVDFFSLALVLNITRSCLPQSSSVDILKPSYTPLEALWWETYQLLQRQGYAFWEDTIAEQTRILGREFVYRLGRYQVKLLLEKNGIDIDMSVIASTIARIEALVQSKDLAEPTAWDRTWDMRWKEVWGKHGPVPRQQKGGIVQSLARAIRGTTTVSVAADGRTAGRTAGRTPVELSLSKTTSTIMRTIFTEDRSQPSGADTSSIPRGENGSIIPPASNPHSPTETIISDLHNDISTERYSYIMNWLGYSCLLSGSETCRVWATPRESAIEFAWNTVWSVAQSAGEDAAEAVLGLGMRVAENDSQTQIKRTSARSSLLSGILSQRTAARLKIRVNRRHSTSHNLARQQFDQQPLVDATPGGIGHTRIFLPNPTSLENTYFLPRDSSHPADHVLVEDPQTSMPSAGTDSPVQASFPQVERSALPPTPRSRLPDFSLRSIPEGPSHTYNLPSIPPRRVSRAMSEPVPASTSTQVPVGQNSNPIETPNNVNGPRRRRESAIKRLREHVVTRWSDPLRYINTELEDAFTKKTQERDYHRKKSVARKDAVRMITNDSDLLEKLPEEGIRLAREAWESAETTVGKHQLEQKLKALARQEWEKLVERHKVNYLSAPLQDDPDWEEKFMSTWKRAWQESWAAAWTGVCNQAYNEATTRSVEFGVEKILDSQSTLNRQTYQQLLKGSSYFKLCELLSKDLKSPSASLEQIVRWMKELGYLSESLQHSIPTLRDDCMEITVFESIKPETMAKTTRALLGSLGAADVKLTSRKMTHYEFQKWVTSDYIVRKIHKDDPVYRLFLRGIEEVWDSISRPGAT